MEGMLIVGGIDSNDHSPAFISFKEKYIEKFDENPTFSSVYSYETALALFKALEMGPDLTPANIKKNIISIENFEGLQSTYEIDKYGDNTRKYMIFKIKNGELARVDLHEKA